MRQTNEELLNEHGDKVAAALRDLQRRVLELERELTIGEPHANELPIGPVIVYKPNLVRERNDYGQRIDKLIGFKGAYPEDVGRRLAGEAIAQLEYTEERVEGVRRNVPSVRCYGSIGVPQRFIDDAIKINLAKDKFRQALKPLSGRTQRAKIKRKDGSIEYVTLDLITIMLRSIQEARVNVLAAYRHIPVFTEQVNRITFQHVESQSIEAKTKEQLLDMIAGNLNDKARRDRAKLDAVPDGEKLSRPKEKYERLQVRVSAARRYTHPKSGRERTVTQVMQAELPLLYPIHPSWPEPEIQLPTFARRDEKGRPRRLEDKPFLETLEFYRKREPYLTQERKKREEELAKARESNAARKASDLLGEQDVR